MQLEQFTQRKSPLDGKPYPRCQHHRAGVQCDRPVYFAGLCYAHETKKPRKK